MAEVWGPWIQGDAYEDDGGGRIANRGWSLTVTGGTHVDGSGTFFDQGELDALLAAALGFVDAEQEGELSGVFGSAWIKTGWVDTDPGPFTAYEVTYQAHGNMSEEIYWYGQLAPTPDMPDDAIGFEWEGNEAQPAWSGFPTVQNVTGHFQPSNGIYLDRTISPPDGAAASGGAANLEIYTGPAPVGDPVFDGGIADFAFEIGTTGPGSAPALVLESAISATTDTYAPTVTDVDLTPYISHPASGAFLLQYQVGDAHLVPGNPTTTQAGNLVEVLPGVLRSITWTILPPRHRFLYDRRAVAPHCRVWPREDKFGPSPRLWPAPKSIQTPGRAHGYM